MLSLESPSLSYKNTCVSIEHIRRHEPCVSWFVNGKCLWRTRNFQAFRALKKEVCRTTIIHSPLGSIFSPEHLAPVFLLWNQESFNVHVKNLEVPLMDGSALPWFYALRHLAKVPQALSFYDFPIKEEWSFPNGFVKIAPAETFEVEYSLSRDHYSDSAFVSIYDGTDLLPILSARTFIFEEDFYNVRKNGLLAGVDEKTGLLVKTNSLGGLEILSGGPWRHPQEPILHKILDLIGDLTLHYPFLPKLRITIHNGGHIVHHQILERLLAYVIA